MLFFVIIIVVLELIFTIGFRYNKGKDIDKRKFNIYGLFMDMNKVSAVALSCAFIKFIFIIWSIFDTSDVGIIHLLFLLFLSIGYGLFSFNFKHLIIELISSVGIYFALVCSELLSGYCYDVRDVWYISFGNKLLILFIIFYSLYFLLRNFNYLVSKSRFVRRNRVEDS